MKTLKKKKFQQNMTFKNVKDKALRKNKQEDGIHPILAWRVLNLSFTEAYLVI